jgi:hypothetical protein
MPVGAGRPGLHRSRAEGTTALRFENGCYKDRYICVKKQRADPKGDPPAAMVDAEIQRKQGPTLC